MPPVGRGRHLGCLQAFATTDFRDDLTKISVPTLVIHGDYYGIVPFEGSGRRTHEAIDGSELHVIEGGPHGINVSDAGEFNRALLEFLERRRSGGDGRGEPTPSRQAGGVQKYVHGFHGARLCRRGKPAGVEQPVHGDALPQRGGAPGTRLIAGAFLHVPIGYWVVSLLAAAGAVFAGSEHPTVGPAALRGLVAGIVYGIGILIVFYSIRHGVDIKVALSPSIGTPLVTGVAGAVLTAIGAVVLGRRAAH